MSKIFVGMTLDRPLLEQIDRARGLVKRSTFVNDLLKKSISGAESDKSERERSHDK
jgi:metal-responsive CopG/Arc/MetJ family transcriptional regulator